MHHEGQFRILHAEFVAVDKLVNHSLHIGRINLRIRAVEKQPVNPGINQHLDMFGYNVRVATIVIAEPWFAAPVHISHRTPVGIVGILL